MNDDQLELIATNVIEITMVDALSDMEARRLIEGVERYGIDASVNASGRIAVFEVHGDEQMQDILGEMGDMGLVEDIGLIRIITELEPQWERQIEVQFH